MLQIVRNLLLSNTGLAERLLGEYRGLPDTKPSDVAQFVNDVSSGASGVVDLENDCIFGILQVLAVGNDVCMNIKKII